MPQYTINISSYNTGELLPVISRGTVTNASATATIYPFRSITSYETYGAIPVGGTIAGTIQIQPQGAGTSWWDWFTFSKGSTFSNTKDIQVTDMPFDGAAAVRVYYTISGASATFGISYGVSR